MPDHYPGGNRLRFVVNNRIYIPLYAVGRLPLVRDFALTTTDSPALRYPPVTGARIVVTISIPQCRITIAQQREFVIRYRVSLVCGTLAFRLHLPAKIRSIGTGL